MNDFTREELNFIWQRLVIADYSNFKNMQELPNKVCAMIENYCEHETIGLYNDADYVYFCRDCSRVTGAI